MLNRAALEHTLHSLHQARVHIAFFHALTSLSEEIGQRQELRGTGACRQHSFTRSVVHIGVHRTFLASKAKSVIGAARNEAHRNYDHNNRDHPE
jgi:hypothetical protein